MGTVPSDGEFCQDWRAIMGFMSGKGRGFPVGFRRIMDMEATRQSIDLNRGWAFAKKRMPRRWLGSSEPGTELVDLPHCWNEKDAFQEGISYYRGYGSYRKTFSVPPDTDGSGRVWRIEAGGFYGTGDVWLNGRRLAAVDGQYLGFSLDPGSNLRIGEENLLGVRLTNRCAAYVLPGIRMPDFLLYGGLSARVRLVSVPRLRVSESDVRIWTRNALSSTATVCVEFSLRNDWDIGRRCDVCWELLNLKGEVVSRTGPVELAVSAGRLSGGGVELSVSNPTLWSLDSPELYTLRCTLRESGEVIDLADFRVGIREAEFRLNSGFFLNGRRVPLRGCNRHENIPGFGRALPLCLHREDALIIKESGLNFVRLSHYPQHPAFLDACDELGILVYPEVASWKSVRKGRWLRRASRQMADMLRRDRNHPSIILWGMGNESRSRKAYSRLRSIVRRLDETRPVIYAENHFYRAERERTLDFSDVWGLNYEFDALEDGRNASTSGCVVVSECSNYPHTIRGDLSAEARQVEIIEMDLAKLAGKPFVAGFALWCLNDYATLRKGRYKRYSGLVDAWRIPKMSLALLNAYFAGPPCVFLFGDWGEAGPVSREIHVFTNCDEVILSLNGKELHKLSGSRHYLQRVDFERGDLVATALKETGSVKARLNLHSQATRLQMDLKHLDDSACDRSMIVVGIRVVDGGGRTVRTWHGEATVIVTGPGLLRSYRDGDIVCVRGGIGRTYVARMGRGRIDLTVMAGGLAGGSASVD